jgi:hypothetical protein
LAKSRQKRCVKATSQANPIILTTQLKRVQIDDLSGAVRTRARSGKVSIRFPENRAQTKIESGIAIQPIEILL